MQLLANAFITRWIDIQHLWARRGRGQPMTSATSCRTGCANQQLRAKRAAQIVEVLFHFLARVCVDVDDTCSVANAVETSAKAVGGPRLAIAIHKDRIHADLSVTRPQLSQKAI